MGTYGAAGATGTYAGAGVTFGVAGATVMFGVADGVPVRPGGRRLARPAFLQERVKKGKFFFVHMILFFELQH